MKINTKELEFWWFTIVIVTTGVLILELFTGNSNSVNNLYLAAYVANCALFIAVSARLKDAQKGNIEIISPLLLTALIYIKLYLFYQLNPKEVGSDLQEIGVALRNSRGVTTEGYRSIDTVGDYLYQFMMELYRGDTKLPLEAKARLYIFYFEYCPLVMGLRKAKRYYSDRLYDEECRRFSAQMENFIFNLAEIMDDPQVYKNYRRGSKNWIREWAGTEFHWAFGQYKRLHNSG